MQSFVSVVTGTTTSNILEQAKSCLESCLLFVALLDLQLVKSCNDVQLCEDFGGRELVQRFSD